MQTQPVAINAAIGAVLSTGVALAAVLWPGGIAPATQALVIAFGNSVIVLGVIIATRAQVTPIAAPTLKAGTQVSVQGTADSVTIQPSPPGPTGTDGMAIMGTITGDGPGEALPPMDDAT